MVLYEEGERFHIGGLACCVVSSWNTVELHEDDQKATSEKVPQRPSNMGEPTGPSRACSLSFPPAPRGVFWGAPLAPVPYRERGGEVAWARGYVGERGEESAVGLDQPVGVT